MASSGRITIKHESYEVYADLDWEITERSEEENRSRIKWALKYRFGDNIRPLGSYSGRDYSLSINGTPVARGDDGYISADTETYGTLKEGYTWINHDEFGHATFTASYTVWFECNFKLTGYDYAIWIGWVAGSGTGELEPLGVQTTYLEPTVADVNNRTLELTGNSNTFIKYYSTASFDINPVVKKGATIEYYTITCGSTTLDDYTSATGEISNIDSNTLYFSAKDSSGGIAREARVVNLIPYVKLTSALSTDSLRADGSLTFTVRGKYFNGFFGAKNNTMEIEYSVRDKNGNYVFNSEGSGWVILGTVTPTVDDLNNYIYSYTINGLDYSQQYELSVNVIDELSPQIAVTTVIQTIPVFDWSADDFHHHTNVYISNDKNIYTKNNSGEAINLLETNADGSAILGYGNYTQYEGQTNIYGNKISLISNSDITINGRAYGTNQILWQGASHMNGGQSAPLAQSVSAQPNGIVLVFSLYRNNAAENVSINSFFVSKKEVELLGSAPHTFLMMINSGFSVIGAKYLTISDDNISGNATNTSSGANNGITFNNSMFVLRYVIGV